MSELSKLRWHCRRGIKELDIVLNKYLDEHFEQTKDSEPSASNTAFIQLINLEDPLLYSLILGTEKAKSPEQEAVLHKLQNLYIVK